MARYDDLNTRSIAYGAFVSTIILLLIILVLRALCYGWVESELQRKLAGARYESADAVLQQQQQLLETYGTIEVEVPPPADQPEAEPTKVTRIHIPVERAAELFLQELQQQDERQANVSRPGRVPQG
ncbi:MAG: hypothetical protein KatS3mg111_2987 [Pirellulaceae bacterium]|nr:MAG: hypothetical protein KatS3mg111_2987 [Pirellulaceae bacterium]